MKLPVYKPGTIKKALLAFAGIGVTGAVIKYKSHTQGQLEGGLEDFPEDHGLSWYLQEALDVTTGSAREAGHTLLHLLHALRAGWAGRLVTTKPAPSGSTAAAPSGSTAAAGGEQRLSLPSAVAEFLASLAEEPERSRAGYALAGSRLLDWLLDAALGSPHPEEQLAVERFLARMLSDEEAASALLERPEALPKLLRLADGQEAAEVQLQPSGRAGKAQQAQQARQRGGQPQLAALLESAVQSGWLPTKVQLEDAHALLEVACHSPRPGTQLLALQLLRGLAHASVLNCRTLAAAGGGRRLAELAAAVSTGEDADGVQLEIARLMTTLATNCPDRGELAMSRWLYHLLCFAADAAANRNWQLAAASLGAFASCLRAGSPLREQLMSNSALPLLHQLASQQQVGVPMKAAIASAVGAMAESRGAKFPLAEREHWSELLLGWLHPNLEQPPELLSALAGALSGLASLPGPDGLHVAHAWLAEILVHLSLQLEASRASRAARQGSRAGAAAGTAQPQGRGGEGAAAAAAASGGGGGGSWWRFWAGSSAEPASKAAAGASGSAAAAHFAVAAAGGSGTGQLGAIVGLMGEEATAAAEVQAALELEHIDPPQQPLGPDSNVSSSSSSSSSSSGGGGGGSSSSGPTASQVAVAGSNSDSGGAAAAAQAPAAAAAQGGSWWWPFGGGKAASEGSTGALGGGAGGIARPTSDSELAEFLKDAPVGPLYARSVAAELLEASGRVGTYQEPPPDAEDLMTPDAIAAYAQVAATVDMEVADKALCQALKVLCALVSGDCEKQRWLRQAGLLPLLHRLTISHPRDLPEMTSPDYFSDALPLCIRRQAARLLAMVTADVEGARAVQKGGWVSWLQNIAVSTDCKVSSCAARALLHIESAGAQQRHPVTVLPWSVAKLPRSPPQLLPQPDPEPEGDVLEQAQLKLQAVRRKIDRQLDAVRPPVAPEARLVLGDGVHLFDPLAPHHEVLAREGTGSQSKDAPLVDVVFVHGIRGGAFATWRRDGVLQRGQARENLERDTCWPGAWLAKEIPEARLLSIEYPAPASGWEGESFPLTHTAVRLMDKLAAAGVGQRPVIFVTHSMGGLVIKEVLALAAQDPAERFHRLATAARGAVFYSVPHFGAKLAAYGWQLRYVGGSPAAVVEQLRPGPHLDQINSLVKSMCKSGQLPVLSFSEGQQTKLGYVKTSIVPHESAYPGYGEFVVLPQHDHINVCKPADRTDPSYARLAAFLAARLAEVKAARAEELVSRLDHMEAAAL